MSLVSNTGTLTITASALGTLAASMSVGQWAQFTTGLTGYLTTCTEPLGGATDPASGHVFGFIDKGCWDSVGKRILFVTSDHFHGTGQARFVQYDDATSTWSRLPAGSWFPTVTASARHGYHHNAIDVVGRKLYHKLFSVREVYRCDLSGPITSGSWTRMPDPPTNYNASAIGTDFVPWVGSQGSYMTHQNDSGSNGSMYRFDPAGGQWTIPANQTIPNSGDIHNIFEASPSIQYAIMGGGNGGFAGAVRNVSVLNPSGTLLINIATAPQSFAIQGSVVTHCPNNGDFIFIYGATNWWKYNAITNTFTQMAGTAHIMDGGTTSGDGVPTGIVAIPISTYGVIVFAKMIAQNNGTVWVYKHS